MSPLTFIPPLPTVPQRVQQRASMHLDPAGLDHTLAVEGRLLDHVELDLGRAVRVTVNGGHFGVSPAWFAARTVHPRGEPAK